jgi:hypothetical protein
LSTERRDLTAHLAAPCRRPCGVVASTPMSKDTTPSEHGVDAETTVVPPPQADAPELAWSADDGATPVPAASVLV